MNHNMYLHTLLAFTTQASRTRMILKLLEPTRPPPPTPMPPPPPLRGAGAGIAAPAGPRHSTSLNYSMLLGLAPSEWLAIW